ncbi:MAG: toll/interleukin-1 receptor domain-containing protein [Pseudomonadota bacterium]
MAADIFISYSRADKKLASVLANHLERSGFSVWYDIKGSSHDNFVMKINEMVEACEKVITIWSSTSRKSMWVISESMEALRLNKLICLRVDNATPPIPFNSMSYIDLPRGVSLQTWTEYDSLLRDLPNPSRDQSNAQLESYLEKFDSDIHFFAGEAAERLNLDRSNFEELLRRGGLPAPYEVRKGNKKYRVFTEEYIEESKNALKKSK